jgi:hypothetical protein
MEWVSGDTWRMTVPIPAGRAGTVDYYIEAIYAGMDAGGLRYPETAPSSTLNFQILDTGGGVGFVNPRQFGPSSQQNIYDDFRDHVPSCGPDRRQEPGVH